MKRLIVGLATSVLVSGGLGLAGLGAGTAQALTGPFRWCPGQSLWISGNHVTNPVVWDNSVCHTYYMVDFGQGNVAQNVWDGPDPPAPPPPPPSPGLNFCPIPPGVRDDAAIQTKLTFLPTAQAGGFQPALGGLEQ